MLDEFEALINALEKRIAEGNNFEDNDEIQTRSNNMIEYYNSIKDLEHRGNRFGKLVSRMKNIIDENDLNSGNECDWNRESDDKY